MGYHEVVKCARCGAPVDAGILSLSTCARCGQALHACVQCAHFNTGATFECTQPIKARVSPKDARNTCTYFATRTTVERQTGSAPAAGPTSAKQAFDDLFKF